MIVGHDQAREQLEYSLPQVTLLFGPKGIGKAQLARHLSEVHNFAPIDVYWQSNLYADNARWVVADTNIAPVGKRKLYVLEMDTALESVQNILLKVLEEPPPTVAFILLCSKQPLPTIVSRSQVHMLSLLTDNQVRQVLLLNDVSYELAKEVAPQGRGVPADALAAVHNLRYAKERTVVSTALRAALSGAPELLEKSMGGWTLNHTTILQRWATEASAGRFLAFPESFAPPVTRVQALRVLEVLTSYPGVRMAAFVALERLAG